MTRVALKGLFGRKLRAALTAIAIVLGVAMAAIFPARRAGRLNVLKALQYE
jgi:ABC-type lipoprotein release transport system permease subunit